MVEVWQSHTKGIDKVSIVQKWELAAVECACTRKMFNA